MSVTLKQIAAELNVSQPLVTYALNGKPGVSPHMRQTIIETAQRLGYHKYSRREARIMAAKGRGRRAAMGMLALVFSREGDIPWTAVPYFRAMVDGVEYEAGCRGLDLVIAPYQKEDSLPRIVQERGVDGAIFLSMPVHQEVVQQVNIPVVSLGTEYRGSHSFLPDDEAGVRLAIEHLIDLGHRDIAYLGGAPHISSAQARLEAYRSTLDTYGISINNSFIGVAPDAGREDGKNGMAHLLGGHSSCPFTALVCHNDLIAMGAIDYATAIGLSVPQDLSVVGFDDVSVSYNFQPELTSISFDRFHMGRCAVKLICTEVQALSRPNGDTISSVANSHDNYLNANHKEEAERSTNTTSSHRIFPIRLVTRQSTRGVAKGGV